MIKSLKRYFLVSILNVLFALLAWIRNDKIFKLLYSAASGIAQNLVKKDYYVEKIRWIKDLFDNNHPSLEVTKKILRGVNPHHRKVLIRSAIINQLLVGTNKRKSFSEKPEGFYPPAFFVISPSMKCNLNCYGCYAWDYDKKAELTFEEIDKVLCEAKEIGMYFCVVSGGEPLFHSRIFDVFTKHKDMVFLVYSNGSLIDEAVSQKIVEAGNVLPSISIEGFREETDKRRGKGHFDCVMKAMDLLRKNKIIFGFSATLTRKNTEILNSDEFVNLMIEKGCIFGWYFMYVPIGREPNLDLMPTPEQRGHQFERLTYLRANKPIFLADFWNDGPVVGGCIAAGRKYFHVNANGDVEPCVFAHFSTHNIRTSTLVEAANSDLFRLMHSQLPVSENLLRPCTLIDSPDVSREAIVKCGAHFTHKGAEIIFNDIAEEISSYSVRYKTIADKLWEKHFQNRR